MHNFGNKFQQFYTVLCVTDSHKDRIAAYAAIRIMSHDEMGIDGPCSNQ